MVGNYIQNSKESENDQKMHMQTRRTRQAARRRKPSVQPDTEGRRDCKGSPVHGLLQREVRRADHPQGGEMEDLIKALQIFLKYKNERWPTHCEHDVLAIMGVHIDDVSAQDVEELKTLGFEWDDQEDHFYSFRFGSA